MDKVTINGRVFVRVPSNGEYMCECSHRGLCAFHEDSGVIDYECVCNNDINCRANYIDYIYMEENNG